MKLTQNIVKPDLTILLPNKCRRNYSLSSAKNEKIYSVLNNFPGYRYEQVNIEKDIESCLSVTKLTWVVTKLTTLSLS